jgi:hypothetical protein
MRYVPHLRTLGLAGRLAGGLVTALAGPALAQQSQLLPMEAPQVDMERYTAVRDRKQPAYDAPGLPLGGWRLYPSLTVQAIAEDNIFAQPDGVSDAILRLKPAATLQSNWARHSLTLSGQAVIDRHAQRSSENIEDLDLGAKAVIDLGATTKLRAGAGYFDGHQSRQSQDISAQTLRPIRYTIFNQAAAIDQDLGRLRLSADATHARRNYHDGILADGSVYEQDTVDSDAWRFGLRATFAPTPSVGLFVRAIADIRDFRIGTSITPKRDSRGFQLLGGVEFEPAALIRGSIGVGYIQQRFKSPVYGDLSGLAVNAKVEYFPTQLTTFTLRADRQVRDSGIPGSGGYLSTTTSIEVDHELLRQLILSGSLGLQRDRFDNLDRRDRRVSTSARATYRANRHLDLELRYDRIDQSSRGVDRYRFFTDNRLMLGVTLKR